MKDKKIAAVIILYNPDLSGLLASLHAIAEQVSWIILVDNSLGKLEDFFWKQMDPANLNRLVYVFNNSNIGVAKAQNIGLIKGIELGAEYLLVFDQDSTAEPDMVNSLYQDYQLLAQNGIKIAAIGPIPINKQTGKAYEPRVQKRTTFQVSRDIYKVTELISSGLLVHKNTLEEVGLMDEQLFIDGVDHEWCWRANRKGFSCALSSKARLDHMLGEGDRKILGVRIAITSPFRVFYQYRNFVYLCKRSYVPFYWKLNNMVKYTIKLVYYPIFISPRMLYLRNMVKGIREGFNNGK